MLYYYILLCFPGSPWDWQSGNARYPVFSVYPGQGDTTVTPNPVTLMVNSNITAYEGQTAHLPCRVKNLGEHTVCHLLNIWKIVSNVTN